MTAIQRIILAAFVAVGVGGCRQGQPVGSTEEAPGAGTSIHDVTARGTVSVVVESKDIDVDLDGVLLAQPPRAFRLRVWKLTRTVLDITLVDDQLWLYADKELPAPLREKLANHGADQFARLWDKAIQHLRVTTDKDPASSTIRLPDSKASIELGDLRPVTDGGLHWPMRVHSSIGDAVLNIHFEEIAVNQGLSPRAFRPSRRATKLR